MSILENFLSKIVRYGLYAILLTPLAFWPKALFPFLTPKFILFQILVEIVFAAWLVLAISQPEYRPRFNWLIGALLIFTAVSIVSALFGVDFSRSFWGIGPRMTGFFAELHFLAWFLVLITTLKSPLGKTSDVQRTSDVEESGILSWQTYLNFSFVVALLVAASAFYQNPKWALALGYGIFNNPTFVAPYLIFHFFWGLYQTINRQHTTNNFTKWFFAASSAFLLTMTLFAQIRGAVLGLLVGIFALGIGLIFSDIFNRRFRIILSAVYIFLIVSVAGFWYLRDNPAVQKFSPIKRVTGISLRETTVQTRLLAWRVAIDGFKDYPIFGVGPENFNFLFNAHYNPKFLKFGGGGFGETWFDKPHNAFLEVLTETGIVGAAAYLFIWLAAVFALYKLFKRGEKLLSVILTGAFISYFVSVFFSFDSFGSWFGLYLMLGFLASYHNPNNTTANPNDPNKINNYSGYSDLIRKFGLLIISIFTLVLLWANYSILRANLADADALRIFPSNPAAGIELFKKSLSYRTPYKAEYQFDLVSSIAGALQKNLPLPDLENTLNFALESADKALAAHPKNAAYYTDMAKIYNILGEKGRDPQILAQAEAFGRKSLELSPNRQETLFYLARIALFRNDTKLAVEWAKQAVDAEPSIKQSHWFLGLAYIADNQRGRGIDEIKKALELGYTSQNQAEENFIKNLGL